MWDNKCSSLLKQFWARIFSHVADIQIQTGTYRLVLSVIPLFLHSANILNILNIIWLVLTFLLRSTWDFLGDKFKVILTFYTLPWQTTLRNWILSKISGYRTPGALIIFLDHGNRGMRLHCFLMDQYIHFDQRHISPIKKKRRKRRKKLGYMWKLSKPYLKFFW